MNKIKTYVLLFKFGIVFVTFGFFFFTYRLKQNRRVNKYINKLNENERRGIELNWDKPTLGKSEQLDDCPVEYYMEFMKKNGTLNITSDSECFFVRQDDECALNEVLEFYYCTLRKITYPYNFLGDILFFIIGVLGLCVLFYITADTADEYFCPALIKISDYLKLPPSVAGVTLLAFGNGAGDLFSVIASVVTENAGLALSSAVGGSVFVTNVVFALLAIFSTVEVASFSFLRDSTFMLICSIIISVIYFIRFTGFYLGLLLFGLYGLYITVVVIRYFMSKKQTDIETELNEGVKMDGEERNKEFGTGGSHLLTNDWVAGFNIRPLFATKSVKKRQKKYLDIFGKKAKSEKEGGTFQYNRFTSRILSTIIVDEDFLEKEKKQFEKEKLEKQEELKKSEKGFIGNILETIEWDEKSFVQKLMFIFLGWWCRILRDIIIPRTEEGQWSKFYAVIIGTIGPVFFTFTLFQMTEDLWNNLEEDLAFLIQMIVLGIVAIIGIFFSIFIFLTTKSDKPPKYEPLFVIIAFVNSICVIYITSELLVSVIGTLGKMFGIPTSFLGLTILAWGNSFPDMVANIVMSMKGYPEMAVGACFGGPLLNTMVGVGFLYFYSGLKNWANWGWDLKNLCIGIYGDPGLSVSFVTLLIQTVATLIFVVFQKFKVPKYYGYILISLYIIQFIVFVIVLIETLFQDNYNLRYITNFFKFFPFGEMYQENMISHTCPTYDDRILDDN